MLATIGAVGVPIVWSHGNHGQGHGQGASRAAMTSVGGKLAADLQGKPVVVQIKSRNCPMCKAMEPTMGAVKSTYRGRVTFVTLDVTDAAAVREAEKVATQAGLQNFLRDAQTRTGLILAVNPGSGAVWEQFRPGATETQIATVLDRAIAELGGAK
ncbi:MAG: thioredoxin family protein [Oscillatoriales cyanobacterium SM2_1_8]|nr:thioredoxin family protein [Oscillatoriales cyanobacterium SM2_1_8]